MFLKCILLFLTLSFSLLFGFGEQPIRPNNIAASATLMVDKEKYPEYKKVIDGDLNTAAEFSALFLDLGKLQYLDKIEVFQKENLDGIMLSQDIVNWTELIKPTGKTNERYTFELKGQEGRYLKVLNSKGTPCSEITVYPYTDYTLQFENLTATPDITSCLISVKTNVSVLTNTIYGYNYDFIYNKKLEFAISTLTPGKENIVRINDLKPETTYRYQVIVTDFNNRSMYSNYFTFTTKALAENQ